MKLEVDWFIVLKEKIRLFLENKYYVYFGIIFIR